MMIRAHTLVRANKVLVSMPMSRCYSVDVLKAILMLFVVLDPPGNAPLFYFFTRSMDPRKRIETIRTSIVVATIVLVMFALVGELVLKYFGITVNDFRIAGGTILFIYAVMGILGKSLAEEVRGEDIAVVPLAVPLLAGPGSITVVIYLRYVYGLTVTILSIAINMVLSWLLLENGERLLRLLGRRGSVILDKIMSILLAAYSVAMIREGVLSAIYAK